MIPFSRRLYLVVALAAAPTCRSPVATLELEKRTPAVAHGQLVEDLGIETLGGVFTPLLTSGQALPCEITETFSTAADNQEHVEIRAVPGQGEARPRRDAGRSIRRRGTAEGPSRDSERRGHIRGHC